MRGARHLAVSRRWPGQSDAAKLGHGGMLVWAPCRVLGHRRCLAACGAGLEAELAGLGWGHWGWHSVEWLWACMHPRRAQLAATIQWMGHVPSFRVVGAGGDRDKHWVLAYGGGLSACPAHVCCSRARPPLPGPQMVARKCRPVPLPLAHHHASLAPWPRSPAGAQGWEQLEHPEPGWGAPHARPPAGYSTPLGSHPALARGQAGRLWGAWAAGGSWNSPPANQMVPRWAVILRGLPW